MSTANRSARPFGFPVLRTCFALVACAAIGWQVQAGGKSAVGVRVLEDSPQRILLQFDIGLYQRGATSIHGADYAALSLTGEPVSYEAGAPELPYACRSVLIDDSAKMQIGVVEARYYEISETVRPSKGLLMRSQDPASIPYEFGPAYQTDAFYPGTLAELTEPYILRDYRGITVRLHPLQYNPVQGVLRVYTDVTVELVADGKDTVNVLERVRPPQAPSRTFSQVYDNQFVNFSNPARYTPLDETGDMLIIAHDAWVTNMQPLATHHTAAGIDTTVVAVSTIGNTSTAIKTYIQNVYNTSDLAFVLLVGDSTQVATPTASGGSSDPTYSKLVGTDNYPEIFVGRFSAETAAQVDTQVQRTIEYEDLPATQEDWFWRGIGIASAEGAGIGDDGEADYTHMDNIRTDLLNHGYTSVDRHYDTVGATAAQVRASLNAGRGIINYCGHGSTTAWVSTGFSVSDVALLTNYNMLPFIFDVACVNGQFAGYTCFAEAWMRATSGGEPTGAIGIYASSINQSWAPPMAAQDESVDLLTTEAYVTFGGLCYAGSCRMMDEYGTDGANMFNTWHIFGDPSLRVVGVGTPPPFTISCPNGVPTILTPGVTATFDVQIVPDGESIVPGSELLHYSLDGGAMLNTPLVHVSGDMYQAVLPAAACGETPSFYVSATGNLGTTLTDPADAPATVNTARVGAESTPYLYEAETDSGWVVGEAGDTATSGIWNRMDPELTTAQPEDDHSRVGTQCWVTDGRAGASAGTYDVDGGKTTLLSAVFDLAGATDPMLSYWRWYSNSAGGAPNADVFSVDLSNDGGQTWTRVETIGPTGSEVSGGWIYHALRVADFMTPTAAMRLRFIAEDAATASLIEAAVDDVQVTDFSCSEVECPEDLDGNGAVGAQDLAILLAAWESTSEGDIDGNGFTDSQDLALLLAKFDQSCP